MKRSSDNSLRQHTKINVLRIVEMVILVISILMNLAIKLWLYELIPSMYIEAFVVIPGGTTQTIWTWVLMPLYMVTVHPIVLIMHGLPDPYYAIYNMAGNNTNAVIIDLCLTVIWYCFIIKLYTLLKSRLIKSIA